MTSQPAGSTQYTVPLDQVPEELTPVPQDAIVDTAGGPTVVIWHLEDGTRGLVEWVDGSPAYLAVLNQFLSIGWDWLTQWAD